MSARRFTLAATLLVLALASRTFAEENPVASAGAARAPATSAASHVAPATSAASPVAAAGDSTPPRGHDSCFDCHSRSAEKRLSAPTRNFPRDIHAVRGLGCVACHGGNSEDSDLSAMDPDKGFRGKPERKDIAELCAKCHADAAYMKRYNPQPYVFSMAEFRTSVHCKKISEGDAKVATCTNCHGVHGIIPHKDPASPVYHRNVPLTCSGCHNAEYMKGRTVPTNQFALYKNSVHGRAVLDRDDPSAPACNNCHGNHGAVPPNTRDISVVCGNCHGREGELFEKSRVKGAFLLAGRRGCVTCHSNHDVQPPTDAMLSIGPGGVCGTCHAKGSRGERGAAIVIAGFQHLKTSLASADSVLQLAEVRGMETTPARATWREGADRLVAVRAAIHSFDSDLVSATAAEGDRFVADARRQGLDALRDWRMRRVGLALSLIVIVALIGVLIVKIRNLESA